MCGELFSDGVFDLLDILFDKWIKISLDRFYKATSFAKNNVLDIVLLIDDIL